MFDFVSSVITFLADWFLLLASFMIGSVVVWGNGYAKIYSDNDFLGFWAAVRYFLAFTVILTLSLEFVTPFIRDLLYAYIHYLIGITFTVVGIFFVWIVYTGDFDITTQYKWAVPLVSLIVVVLNIVSAYYGLFV